MATAKQVAKGIQDDLNRFTQFIEESLDGRVAQKIGFAVVDAILDLVAKGISPIEGQGRFPAYKWAAIRNQLRKESKAISKELSYVKKQLQGRRRLNQRQLLTFQKERNRREQGQAGARYPFTAEAIAAGKKPRPVNLRLHGDFLEALRSQVVGTMGSYGLEIGFFPGSRDRKGVEAWVKEQGHREGANGQPSRPIIPVGTEEFAQVIQNTIWEMIEAEIDKAAANG